MTEDNKEKRSRRRKMHSRKSFLLMGLMLLSSIGVSGTLAYISTKTTTMENQFEAAYVTCRVNVSSDKMDVTNTGNVDAYIRAAIVVNWMDSDGNVSGVAPTANEYSLGLGTDLGWKQESDGYYYYADVVTPEESTNDTTADLVKSIAVTGEVPSGYELSVEVVAEAIQADGDTDDTGVPAYQDAWGISELSN